MKHLVGLKMELNHHRQQVFIEFFFSKSFFFLITMNSLKISQKYLQLLYAIKFIPKQRLK